MEADAKPVVDVNRIIFYLLRSGVLAAIVLVSIGLLLAAAGSPLSSEALRPDRLPGELGALHPAGFLSLGILVLILTPVARVFLSIFYFAKERDRAYVVITVTVFLILMAGVALGLR